MLVIFVFFLFDEVASQREQIETICSKTCCIHDYIVANGAVCSRWCVLNFACSLILHLRYVKTFKTIFDKSAIVRSGSSNCSHVLK